jgi:hypothetical protein
MEPQQKFQDEQLMSMPAPDTKEKKQPNWFIVAVVSAALSTIGIIIANHFDILASLVGTFINNTDRNVQLWWKDFNTPSAHQLTSAIYLPFNVTIPPWIERFSSADLVQDIFIWGFAFILVLMGASLLRRQAPSSDPWPPSG